MFSHRFTVVFWGVVVFFLALCYEEIDCACENQMENVIIKLKYDPNCNTRFAFSFPYVWKAKLGHKAGASDQRKGLWGDYISAAASSGLFQTAFFIEGEYLMTSTLVILSFTGRSTAALNVRL